MKRKITLTPQVDMELKRQLRRELLGDLKPILEYQGIQFPNIDGVMSDEECRSSLASTAMAPIIIEPTDQVLGGGWPQGELEVVASGPIEGHEQPLLSLESDTIDNLAQPIACSFVVMVGWSYRMEVRKV
jgi:hypothetical protein